MAKGGLAGRGALSNWAATSASKAGTAAVAARSAGLGSSGSGGGITTATRRRRVQGEGVHRGVGPVARAGGGWVAGSWSAAAWSRAIQVATRGASAGAQPRAVRREVGAGASTAKSSADCLREEASTINMGPPQRSARGRAGCARAAAVRAAAWQRGDVSPRWARIGWPPRGPFTGQGRGISPTSPGPRPGSTWGAGGELSARRANP